MEELIAQVLPSLGAFAPAALLAFWVIRDQSRRLEAERNINQELTKMVLESSERTAQVLAELKAALK